MASVLFMSIPAIQDQPGKSFEEVRIEDYLHAYSTAGRPPAPVPQEPTSEQKRTLLNLPPLFKPYSARDTALPSFSNPSVNGALTPPAPPAITKQDDLPESQEFLTTSSEGEVFQNISVMPMFRWFSLEELRCYAYLKGHKLPPSSVRMASFFHVPPLNLNSLPTEMISSRFMPNALSSSVSSETLLSISAQPGFTDHSFEELRVAHLQAGRELNSQEILSANAASGIAPLSRSSLFISGGGGAFAYAPPVRPF
ncbi:hypothetical protein L208DRAFT_1307042 [Tricholoma matsutake]|nr:hypothetical protein L208DRAFT_1307042 [Tricholoma matsutake 945]